MLYYLDRLDEIDDAKLEFFSGFVCPARLETSRRYRFRSDRLQCILAYVLLRAALFWEYGDTQLPEFVLAEGGKPYLAKHRAKHRGRFSVPEAQPDLHTSGSTENRPLCSAAPLCSFNLSHCKKAVACALSSAEVGVDVQGYEPYHERTAAYFMSPEELAGQEKSARYFTRLWAMKESLGKYLGTGLGYPMKQHTMLPGQWQQGRYTACVELDDFVLAYTAEEILPLRQVTLTGLTAFCEALQ